MSRRGGERGSIVLFVLFVCLGVAILVQALSVVVICADRGLEVETTGRESMAAKDGALAEVRRGLVREWGPQSRTSTGSGESEVLTQAVEFPKGGEWALDVTAGQAAGVSPIVVSAWAERGRDGLDLPLAGLVAGTATWALGRAGACVEPEEVGTSGGEAVPSTLAWFRAAPVGWNSLSGQAAPGTLDAPWKLDDGWRLFFTGLAAGADGANGLCTVGRVCVLQGSEGERVMLPAGWGTSPAEPGLAVVVGGASLDATDLGERWGVLVVDRGDAGLEGTQLHGGVFATGVVDLGASGTIAYTQAVIRWATDRSLARVRLVPGSRRETLQ